VRADDLRCRAIDEIPVVDATGVFHVRAEDRLALIGRPAFVRVDEHDQREQSGFVPRIVQQCDRVVERQAAELACNLTRDGNTNAEKLVAGSILTRRRAEESLEELGVVTIAEFPQSSSNSRECGPSRRHSTS